MPKTSSTKPVSKSARAAKTTPAVAPAADTKTATPAATAIADNTVFTLVVPQDKARAAFQKALIKAQQSIKLDGFRLGKAPMRLVEQNVDRSRLLSIALDEVLPQIYRDYLIEHKLLPLVEPDVTPVKVEDGSDWEFTVTVAVRPEIKLGEYQKVVTTMKKTNEFWKEVKEDKTADEKAQAAAATKLRQDRLNAVLTALLNQIKVMVPELLLRRETEHQLRQLAQQLEQLRIPVEKYLEMTKKSMTDLQTETAARALASLQIELLLAAIIADQQISVKPEEVEALLAVQHGHGAEHHHEHSAQEQQYAQSVLLKQKCIDFLLSL